MLEEVSKVIPEKITNFTVRSCDVLLVLIIASSRDSGRASKKPVGLLLSSLTSSFSQQKLETVPIVNFETHQRRWVPGFHDRFDARTTAVKFPTKAHSLAEVHL